MTGNLWAQETPYKGPRGKLALLRGTDTIGTDFPAVAKMKDISVLWQGQIPTPYPRGGTPDRMLSCRFQLLQVADRQVLVFPCHGWRLGEDPHETMATEKIGWICLNAGVHWAIGGGTVGSLNNAVLPGDAVVTFDVDDIDQKKVFMGLPGTELNFVRFKILPRMAQVICPSLARHMSTVAKRSDFSRVYGYDDELVHVCTDGFYLETPAQVRRLKPYGDIVGQSFMDEVRLARLLGIHFCGFHYSVNPAEGLKPNFKWKLDETHHGCEEQAAWVELETLRTMPLVETCGCMNFRGESRPERYRRDLV